MAERVPEEHISISKSGSSARQTPNIVDMFSNENHSTSLTSPESESNGNSVNPILSSGTKAQTEKSDWVVQDEPGVYLTLSSLAGGGNELRRVRFRYLYSIIFYFEKWKANIFNSIQPRI